MEIDLVLIGQILTIVFGVVAGYAGKHLMVVKSLIKELGELFTVTSQAIDDNNVTTDELMAIVKEANDVIRIFNKVK